MFNGLTFSVPGIFRVHHQCYGTNYSHINLGAKAGSRNKRQKKKRDNSFQTFEVGLVKTGIGAKSFNLNMKEEFGLYILG